MSKKASRIFLVMLIISLSIVFLSSCDLFDDIFGKDHISDKDHVYEKHSMSLNITHRYHDGISFEINKTASASESQKEVEIQKIELFLNDQVVQTARDTNVRSFTGLYSGTIYMVRVTYVEKQNGKDPVTRTIQATSRTSSRITPSIDVSDFTVQPDSFTANLKITDPSSVLISHKIELLKDDELIGRRSDGRVDFDNLEPLTYYTLRVSGVYDLGNADGEVEKELFTKRFRTPAPIKVTGVSTLSSYEISPDEVAVLEITLDNQYGATVKSVTICGVIYAARDDSTDDKIIVEVKNDGVTFKGDTELVIEELNATYASLHFSVAVDDKSVNVSFLAAPELLSVELVNSDLCPSVWSMPSTGIYALLTFKCDTGGTVSSVMLEGGDSVVTEVTKIDDSRWLAHIMPKSLNSQNAVSVVSFDYTSEHFSGTFTVPDAEELSYFALASDEIRYISTAEDLKNMKDGRYYELTCDIDLAGLSWYGEKFSGIFNGNGYSIKNMSFSGTVENQYAYFGLFTYGEGIIANLNIVGAQIYAKSIISHNYYDTFCGGIIGYSTGITILNCSVDTSSRFTIHSSLDSLVCVGGLIGSGVSVSIINSESAASLESQQYAGGLIGVGKELLIVNSKNSGSVTSRFTISENVYLGGLVGFGHGKVIDSENSGDVTALTARNVHIGGIFGEIYDIDEMYITSEIIGSHNSGNVSSEGKNSSYVYCGGLVGLLKTGLVITASYNTGNVLVRNTSVTFECAGGLVGAIKNEISILSCQVLIENCYNSGEISVSSSDVFVSVAMAGIVADARFGNSLTINNCYNSGQFSKSGKYRSYVGGILGNNFFNSVNICASLNVGTIVTDLYQDSFIGGILPYSDDSFTLVNCYVYKPYDHALADEYYLRICDIEDIEKSSFYTYELHWSKEVWCFDGLDASGLSLPTLK